MVIFLALFAEEHHSPVAANGIGGLIKVGAIGLSKVNKKTLVRSLRKASDDVNEVLATEPDVSETTKMTCQRKFNKSINALTASLPHPNATFTSNSTAVGPTKNNTAYIKKWVREAGKNETVCLTSRRRPPIPHGRASTVGFSAFSYGLCFVLYFGFVSLVSPVFFV